MPSLIRLFFEEIDQFVSHIVTFTPGRIGSLLRVLYYSCKAGKPFIFSSGIGVVIRGVKNIQLGSTIHIGSFTFISAQGGGSIIIGDKVCFNQYCHINADNEGQISIGTSSLFGPFVMMRASSHSYGFSISPSTSPHVPGRIIIGSNVWCGSGVSILPRSIVPDFSVIAAGAVVNKSFSQPSLLAGIPCQVKRLLLPVNQ